MKHNFATFFVLASMQKGNLAMKPSLNLPSVPVRSLTAKAEGLC